MRVTLFSFCCQLSSASLMVLKCWFEVFFLHPHIKSSDTSCSWISLYLSRAEKQRMYSVIQRSPATLSADRRDFSGSADLARRCSDGLPPFLASLRVWTLTSVRWICKWYIQFLGSRTRLQFSTLMKSTSLTY